MGATQTTPTKPSVTTVVLSPESTPGQVHVQNLTKESAKLVSELLTQNHTLYKTRWKDTLHSMLEPADRD